MKIKLWGVRGSIPAPLSSQAVRQKIYEAIINLRPEVDPTNPDMVHAYVDGLPPLLGGTAGGNTSCVEIEAGEETIIIDAGSGIRELGQKLMEGPCGRGEGIVHLLFSHAHWDHVQGFPFFRPAFVPGNRIIIYSAHAHDWREDVLAPQQRFINFPVPLEVMQAEMEFVHLSPDQSLTVGSLTISHAKMLHPGDAYAFRFDDGHSVFVYASDAEYKAFDEPSLRPYIDFFKNADVLIFDSQLSLREVTFEKEDWGHSSALIGVDLARRANVKKLILFHHDPTHSDPELLQIQADTIEYQAQDATYPPCQVIVAYEGLTFDLNPAKTIRLEQLPAKNAAILTLTPVFDERSVEEFAAQLVRLSEIGWPSHLIIDLTHVRSLAVVGLKPLITLRQEHPDTLIALVGLSERVQRVIKLAGFADFFAIYPRREDALATPDIYKSSGQLIKERYEIEEKVGESALGVVFRATDRQANSTCTVKILSTSFSQQAVDQFLNQARQIIRLDHPHIVNVVDCDRDKGLAFIVQEFMEGQTLHDVLLSHPGRLAIEQAIPIVLQIAQALEYAHSRGVLHGDLKPKNIFLANSNEISGGIKLTDFGLGRLREGQNLLDNMLILQTAHYLAPEQIIGEELDARTDLYALGVILYELVTGWPPFEGTEQHIMQAHLDDEPMPPRKFAPQISRSLEHVILKLLAKDPDERYTTAHQAHRVLSNLGIRGQKQSGEITDLTWIQLRPLIGREAHLQALLKGWARTTEGQGQLLLIAGETGVGKTRLTLEVAKLAQAETLLIGHCHPMEGSLAYQPFIEALRTYFATVPASIADEKIGPLLSNVVGWVPEIRAVLPDLAEAPPLEPQQEQLRLMNSLAQYIEAATQEHPWLLILDDLHWADQSSLQLFHYLARHCREMPLFIIGTYRDTDLDNHHPLLEMLNALQHRTAYKVLNLERLNQTEVGEMLVDIWDETVPPVLVEKIYQVTEGNPFYVEEVAKGLVDEGLVDRQDGAWHFFAPSEIRLPPSVHEAVLQRISLLSRDTQGLLRQAAVLGRNFDFADLLQMSGLSEWVLLEHLDVALERQLVEEAPGEMALRFAHAEIQQVLYQELSALRRRLLHRQAGEALEMRYLADPRQMAEALAHHFDEAGELEKALIYSIQAARHADQAYASQTALMWYGKALDILNQLDLKESTQLQTFDLLLARERLYGRQGCREEQLADLKLAQEIAQRLNNPAQLARVHNQQSYYYRLVSNYPLAAEHAQAALQAARQAKDPLLEGESLSNLAYIEQDQDQYRIALQHMEAAQTILAKTDDRRAEAIALKGLGMLSGHLNDYDQAQAYYEQALQMNQEIGNRRGEAACLNNLGELERIQGSYAAASAYYEQALGINQAIGDRSGEAIALHNLGMVHLTLGSYDIAQSYMAQALTIYHSIEDELGVAEVLSVQSELHFSLDQFKAAKNEAEQAIEVFERINSQANLANALLRLANALEALDDLDTAQTTYRAAQTYFLEVEDAANALDAQAGLARCLLAQDNVSEALIEIEVSLVWLKDHSLTGIDHPFRFYLTAYNILQAAEQTERAYQLLKEAHTLLQARAATIDDEDLCHTFLKNVSQNQAIMEAWQAVGTNNA